MKVEQVVDIIIFWKGYKYRFTYLINGLVIIVAFKWIRILFSFYI